MLAMAERLERRISGEQGRRFVFGGALSAPERPANEMVTKMVANR
jgi:hypothetical protein